MNTIIALFIFGGIVTAVSQWQRVRLLKGARAQGWTVEPAQMTPTSIGPWISKTVGDFRVRVSLPVISAENWGKGGAPWKPRWHIRIEGVLAAVPRDGIAVTRRAQSSTMAIPRGLKKVRTVLDEVAVARATDDAAADTLLQDGDARTALTHAFRAHAPIVEVVLLPTAVEVRAHRRAYSFVDLDELCTEAVSIAESLEAA